MTRTSLAALIAATPLSLLACGGGDDTTAPPGQQLTSGTSTSTGAGGQGGDGGTGTTGTGSGGASTTGTTTGVGGSTTGSGGGGGSAGGELGPIPIDPIPDTACVPKGGTTVEAYSAATAPPFFDRLETVGARRAAGGWQTGGLYTMNADGTGASALPLKAGPNYNLFASEGATVGLVASDASITYQRYDENGAAVGQALAIDGQTPDSLAIAGGAGASLVVWARGAAIHARGVDAGGALAGPTFELGAGAYGTLVHLAAARTAAGFAVAWTGDIQGGAYRTSIALATATGVTGAPVEITTSDFPHQVVKLVSTPSGFALLMTGGQPEFAPYVLLLDDAGQVVGSAHKLEGAYFGWDIAVQGSEIGVVAARSTLEPEFRPFDAAMVPLGSWVCLDDPTDIGDVGAVSADGSGYAVLYRTPPGAEALVRFDHLGTGP